MLPLVPTTVYKYSYEKELKKESLWWFWEFHVYYVILISSEVAILLSSHSRRVS